MSTDQTDWLEISKALGPYVVALIAMSGTFLSAWLSQRNWQKQFGKQQSVEMLNKRVELAQESSLRFFEAGQHSLQLLLQTRLVEALVILNSEGRGFSQETIEKFASAQRDASISLQNAASEISQLFIAIQAYFDDQIYKQAVNCFEAINRIHQSPEIASSLRSDLKQSLPEGVPLQQVLDTLTDSLKKHAQPINSDVNERIGKLARAMVEYAKANS